mgnify:CR=1 FL=1
MKKVYAYKVVRIKDETSCNMQFLSNSLLIKEYKDASIVEAYPGTPGIFLFKRLKDCKNFVLTFPDIWKVKRVIPLKSKDLFDEVVNKSWFVKEYCYTSNAIDHHQSLLELGNILFHDARPTNEIESTGIKKYWLSKSRIIPYKKIK